MMTLSINRLITHTHTCSFNGNLTETLTIKIILTINRGGCVTLVLLHYGYIVIISGSEHCGHARVSAGLVPLTLKFQFSN